MSSRIVRSDERLTVVLYVKGQTDQRVMVDGLCGTEVEVTDTALGVLLNVAANSKNLIARVIARDAVTELPN